MEYDIKIYEYDHWHREYEDHKNNLYLMVLNCDIEKWIEENLSNSYDINCDDHCNDGSDFMIMEFVNYEDATAFKLRWL